MIQEDLDIIDRLVRADISGAFKGYLPHDIDSYTLERDW